MDEENFVIYAGKVNFQCKVFKLKEIKENMFKYLVFVKELTTKNEKEICSRLLSLIENDTCITLQKFMEECQKLIKLQRDNKSIDDYYQYFYYLVLILLVFWHSAINFPWFTV